MDFIWFAEYKGRKENEDADHFQKKKWLLTFRCCGQLN